MTGLVGSGLTTSGTGLITGIGLTADGDRGPVGDLDRILNVGAFGFPNV